MRYKIVDNCGDNNHANDGTYNDDNNNNNDNNIINDDIDLDEINFYVSPLYMSHFSYYYGILLYFSPKMRMS